MEKYQPNLEITLKFLNGANNVKYVLPSNLLGEINHPKYKIFCNKSIFMPFVCKKIDENNNEYFFNIDDANEKQFIEMNSIGTLETIINNLTDFTFYIENFSKSGLNCPSDLWKYIKNELENRFKDTKNVIFLWPNDNANNS